MAVPAVSAIAAVMVLGTASGRAVAKVPSVSACAKQNAPSTNAGAPPAALLSIVGVLRGPPTPPPAWLLERPILRLDSNLYVNYVRFARAAFGARYYVYVAGPFAALMHDCQTTVGVHLFGVTADGGFAFGAASAARIEQSGDWGSTSSGTGANPGVTLFSGVVPDGVATVTLHYPAGKIGGFSRRKGPAVTIKAHVINNVVVVKVPRAGEQATSAVTTTWHAANGTTIKTIHGGL